MTDKELTAAAARAAGYNIEPRENGTEFAIEREGRWFPFAPIDDDGDALRLAVSLGLNIDVYRKEPTNSTASVEVRAFVTRRSLVLVPARDNGESLQMATRRAIVMAAAKIGDLK